MGALLTKEAKDRGFPEVLRLALDVCEAAVAFVHWEDAERQRHELERDLIEAVEALEAF